MAKKYDDAKIHSHLTIVPNLTGISVPGTAASATDLLRIPLASEFHTNKVRMRLITGGTAAGPTITFNKSVGGTGAVSAIGTYAFGTQANGSVASVTLSETSFDSGDEIVIQNVAGTVAASPAIVFTLGYND